MNKIKNITLTDELQSRVRELKEELGYPSETMVIYAGINELHRKMFPPHTAPARKDPKAKAEDKIEAEKMKQDIAHEEQKMVCDALGGKLLTKDGGSQVCQYFTYAGRKRYAQETPLHLLSQDIVSTQYSPDRSTVERLQLEGKTDYNPVVKSKNKSSKK